MMTLRRRAARTPRADIVALALMLGGSSGMATAEAQSLGGTDDLTWAVRIAERYPTIVAGCKYSPSWKNWVLM
jgi:hypothetical protein